MPKNVNRKIHLQEILRKKTPDISDGIVYSHKYVSIKVKIFYKHQKPC